MSKVIMFSREFPKGHCKEGQPTRFVEKFWRAFYVDAMNQRYYIDYFGDLFDLNFNLPYQILSDFKSTIKFNEFNPKYHTIRKGSRFKVGDKFSPRVWAGKPYRSKQIIISPDIEVKKTWDIVIRFRQTSPEMEINGKSMRLYDFNVLNIISQNDGLTIPDFMSWFMKDWLFEGQIICWNESVSY